MFIARIIPHGLFPICGESSSIMRRLSGNQREFSVNATGIRWQPDGVVAVGFVSNQERIKPRTNVSLIFPTEIDAMSKVLIDAVLAERINLPYRYETAGNAACLMGFTLWGERGNGSSGRDNRLRSLDLLVFPWGGGLAWLQLDEASVSCMKALLCWACVVYHRRNHLTEGDFHG